MSDGDKVKSQGMLLNVAADATPTVVDVLVGCPTSISKKAGEKGQVDATCLASAAREFEAGFSEAGTLGIELIMVENDPGQLRLEELELSGDTVAWEISFANGRTEKFNGYVASLGWSAAIDEVVAYSLSIQINGAVTITNPTTP